MKEILFIDFKRIENYIAFTKVLFFCHQHLGSSRKNQESKNLNSAYLDSTKLEHKKKINIWMLHKHKSGLQNLKIRENLNILKLGHLILDGANLNGKNLDF